MTNKKHIVISGLRTLIDENNNKILNNFYFQTNNNIWKKVKKNLIQTIIAMAYHDYLKLEGGFLMVEFILKQCSLPEDDVIFLIFKN